MTSDARTYPSFSQVSLRRRLVTGVVIFLIAFGVRTLSWHDTRREVGKVQSSVAADYRRVAALLREGGVGSFFSSSSGLSDLNTLGHPPGYSILIALTHSLFKASDPEIQFIQIICDALSAVVIFLIVGELLSFGAATIAGMLAAFSPQLAWNSVLLLPDSLAVLPILLAIYFLARAIRRPRLIDFLFIGALIGLSCWLRANAMMLTFFVAALVALLLKAAGRWSFALAVLCGTLLIILPLTLRNAIVFHRFIPLSLGAGQTMLEGIADYDTQGSFGIPRTDVGIMQQEAEVFHRPDYAATLFNPDGVEREHARLARGLSVVGSHPLWFAGVMIRRASTMIRLERTRLISTTAPVTHSLTDVISRQPSVTITPSELLSRGRLTSPQAQVVLAQDGRSLNLTGDDSKYDEQFFAPLFQVRKNTDYAVTVPITIDGRMRIALTAGKTIYYSAIAEREEGSPAPSAVVVQMPFAATREQEAQIVFRNEASQVRPIAQIGTLGIYELGPARLLWTRYPRLIVHGIQKAFLTAVMLPLAIAGFGLLVVNKRYRVLVILLTVPFYYFCVQSIVHTEYRYVLAVDYFLFALAAVTMAAVCEVTGSEVRRRLAALQSVSAKK